jgi:hypothetical protein
MQKNWTIVFATSVVLWLTISSALEFDSPYDSSWTLACGSLQPNRYKGCVPAGNLTAGVYTKKKEIEDIETCVTACCEEPSCNVLFFYNGICYLVNKSVKNDYKKNTL